MVGGGRIQGRISIASKRSSEKWWEGAGLFFFWEYSEARRENANRKVPRCGLISRAAWHGAEK